MTPAQIAFQQSLQSALDFGVKKFKVRGEYQLLRQLVETVTAVRNSAPEGQQYFLPHALRQALNTLKFEGEMRVRYRSMAGHFFAKMKSYDLKRVDKEQIPLTGEFIMNEQGQLGWIL